MEYPVSISYIYRIGKNPWKRYPGYEMNGSNEIGFPRFIHNRLLLRIFPLISIFCIAKKQRDNIQMEKKCSWIFCVFRKDQINNIVQQFIFNPFFFFSVCTKRKVLF